MARSFAFNLHAEVLHNAEIIFDEEVIRMQ